MTESQSTSSKRDLRLQVVGMIVDKFRCTLYRGYERRYILKLRTQEEVMLPIGYIHDGWRGFEECDWRVTKVHYNQGEDRFETSWERIE